MRARWGCGWGIAGLLVALGPAAASGQCRQCSPQMICITAGSGAYVCSGAGFACAMSIPCPLLVEDDPSGGGYNVVLTLHDDPTPGATFRGGAPAFKLRGASAVLDGRTAKRIVGDALRRPGGVELAAGRFITAGGPFSAAFRTRGGGGYAVSACRDGSALRVTVRELLAGKPLRVVANESLDADDVLVARLRIDGRPYVMALQARALHGSPGEIADRERRTQEALYAELRALPRRAELDVAMTGLDE